MKSRMRRCLWVGVVGGLLPIVGYGQAELFEDGITLDANDTSFLVPYWVSPNATRTNVELSAFDGGLYLYAGKKESAKGRFDGGASIFGNPISLVLGDDNPLSEGSLAVWGSTSHYLNTGSWQPLFRIDAVANEANFDGVAVNVYNGSLAIEGSPVITNDSLNSALSSVTPPANAAWTAVYFRRGNVLNGAAFSTGGATASGTSSVAHGNIQTVASGAYSHAAGINAVSSGTLSSAIGNSAYATGSYSAAQGSQVSASGTSALARGLISSASGDYSSANGYNLEAQSYLETVTGRFNKTDPSPTPGWWIEEDAIFRIGNGTDPEPELRSDAVTVRKNGETTLTNKVWKDYNLGVGNPPIPDAAGGKALVVDGHTLLNGRVTIAEPQGDISMGIYQ